jgi:hypothetical protein
MCWLGASEERTAAGLLSGRPTTHGGRYLQVAHFTLNWPLRGSTQAELVRFLICLRSLPNLDPWDYNGSERRRSDRMNGLGTAASELHRGARYAQ